MARRLYPCFVKKTKSLQPLVHNHKIIIGQVIVSKLVNVNVWKTDESKVFSENKGRCYIIIRSFKIKLGRTDLLGVSFTLYLSIVSRKVLYI